MVESSRPRGAEASPDDTAAITPDLRTGSTARGSPLPRIAIVWRRLSPVAAQAKIRGAIPWRTSIASSERKSHNDVQIFFSFFFAHNSHLPSFSLCH
jgi:hypothetical protein